MSSARDAVTKFNLPVGTSSTKNYETIVHLAGLPAEILVLVAGIAGTAMREIGRLPYSLSVKSP